MFYRCKNSHCGEKVIIQPTVLSHNAISYTGHTIFFYLFSAQVILLISPDFGISLPRLAHPMADS